MTAKSDELVNELVSAAIAFGRGREPDWQTRIEDARVKLREYIEGLESELVELQPYRDGYDAYDVFPEDGDNVIANLGSWVFLAHYRNNEWYDSLGEQPKIRGGVERWWKLPEVQE